MTANTVASRKAKGRNLQNYVCDAIKGVYSNVLEPDDIRPAIMGESGTDIRLSPSAKKLLAYDIECKNTERLDINRYWKQTIDNTALESGRKPLLIWKKNHQEPLVIMRFSDWLEERR